MKTVADVIRWIETDSTFTPAFQKKVLGSVRKMKKLPQYDKPLEQIPADLDAFDKVWGRGPVRTIPSGFKSKSQFADWRSQARSALTGFLDIPTRAVRAEPEDDWSRLRSDLEAVGIHQKRLIPVTVLANAARKASLTPMNVSRAWLQENADAPGSTGHYRALKAAQTLIQKYRDAITTPVSPDFGATVCKSRTHCSRLDLPPRFASEVSSWQEKFTQGLRKGHLRKRKSARSLQRANQVLRGVTYVYTAMVSADLIDPERDPSISDMLSADALNEVIERELMGEFPWRKLEVTTLFEYLNNWRLFVRGCGHNAEDLAEVITDFTEFENVKTMSTARRDWSEDFMHNTHKHAAFFNLPNMLFGRAKKAMLAYETSSLYEKDIAIALGIAACAAAIWTSLPLRISTLLRLTHGGGEKADVQIHRNRHGLVVTTPPDIVKNGYSHRYITLTAKPGGNPREIVAWFVSEVRPLLLEHHIAPHLRDPARLFGGVSYARLSSIWRSVTLEAGVPMTPHQVRHAIATVMANQPQADYSIIAALLGDTEATIQKNYVVVDQARKSEEGQHLLAQIHGNLLMRGAA